MKSVTIPKELAKKDDLVVIPRKEFEKIIELAAKKGTVSEIDVLRWSREVKKLKKAGKLPILRSLKDLR